MTRLTEVARKAGVTPATVSNVLRQRGRVSDATRERVLAAVAALGYRPHLPARALAEGRAPTIALMVASIANPFYPEFALAVEDALRDSGRFLIICNTHGDPPTGRAYLEQIAGSLSEGVLVMNANLDLGDLHRARERGAQVVLCMWERPDEPPGLPCVAVDFMRAGGLAAEHLLALGHRHIGIIVGSKTGNIHAARYEGFVQTLHDAGLGATAAPLRYADDTTQGGYEAARSLLNANPSLTALFATNDLPALGAMQAAADMGLSVPRQLSVMGLTDIQMARESRPALTTVAVPFVQAAHQAVALLEALGDMGTAPMRLVDPPRLVVRASTARAPLARS